MTDKVIKRALLLYDERILFIGDCCMRVSKLKYVRAFLDDAALHMNFTDKGNFALAEALLKNNPYMEEVSLLGWDEICFDRYDVIFCIAYNERRLRDYLADRYGREPGSPSVTEKIYSLSSLLLIPREDACMIFPIWPELVRYVTAPRPGELYFSEEERDWADNWLTERGLERDESLFIFCDSSAARAKLINSDVYFAVLESLLRKEKTKLLIFDEKNIGKEEFYRRWLGSRSLGKIIFSKGMSLRENLCLIASRYTRLIVGPCTGLMHCASGIYNYYVSKGLPVEKAPVMITYTGIYTKGNRNANFWWGGSPLIDCLLLREKNGVPEMTVLNSLPEGERETDDTLPCSLYTRDMLLSFIGHRIAETKLSTQLL